MKLSCHDVSVVNSVQLVACGSGWNKLLQIQADRQQKLFQQHG